MPSTERHTAAGRATPRRRLWAMVAVLLLLPQSARHAAAISAAPEARLRPLETPDAPRAAFAEPAYRLPLLAVPPVPDARMMLLPQGPTMTQVCPFALRGLVVGETAQDSFAVAGIGDRTRLLRVGQYLELEGVGLTVQRIDSEQIILMRGNAMVRCALPQKAR